MNVVYLKQLAVKAYNKNIVWEEYSGFCHATIRVAPQRPLCSALVEMNDDETETDMYFTQMFNSCIF